MSNMYRITTVNNFKVLNQIVYCFVIRCKIGRAKFYPWNSLMCFYGLEKMLPLL